MNTNFHSISNPERISRGAQVMFRTMRPRRDDLVLPEEYRAPGGSAYHLYSPVEVKARFYHNHIEPQHLSERSDLFDEGDEARQLSALGKLSQVSNPVFLLHDAADQVVPPQQSQSLYDELARRGPGHQQEILVTPWLSHVVLRKTGRLTELARIVSFTSELFRQAA